MTRPYLDFDLALEGEDPWDCRVRVMDSPAGATSSVAVSLPVLERGALGERSRPLQGAADMDADDARALGERLFGVMFSGSVLDAFMTSVQEAERVGAGLRVRLHINEAPAISALPWELLYGPGRLDFLALSARTPIVRHINDPNRLGPLTVELPLRVLVVVADNSGDNRSDGWRLRDPLDELEALPGIQFERSVDGSVAALKARLRMGTYHAFHFVGPGRPDVGARSAVYRFEGPDKGDEHVSSAELGALLAGHASLRLALMDITADADGTQAHRPLVGGPIPPRMPASITLPAAMADGARTIFRRALYQALAAGRPVENAVATARRSVYKSSLGRNTHSSAWAAPSLYLGPSGGQIFDLARPKMPSALQSPDDESLQAGNRTNPASPPAAAPAPAAGPLGSAGPPVAVPPRRGTPSSRSSSPDRGAGDTNPGRSLADILREAGIEPPSRRSPNRPRDSDDPGERHRRADPKTVTDDTDPGSQRSYNRRAGDRSVTPLPDRREVEPSTGPIPVVRSADEPDLVENADSTAPIGRPKGRRNDDPRRGDFSPLRDEDVQFSLYRPAAITVEQWAFLLVLAHKSDQFVDPQRGVIDPLEEVRTRAQRLFGATPTKDSRVDSLAALPRGATLRVVPDLPGLVCNPPVAEFMWAEEVHEAQFRIRPQAALAGMTVRGTVRIWCGVLIVGELPVSIPVLPSGRSATEVQAKVVPGVVVNRYRKIFPSYSHRDQEMVEHFATAARALGDQYLQDVRALRAGERWNDRLLELIAEADIFQLFWSHQSMRSPYCQREWEHALSLDRPSFIRPIYWESPLPEDPVEGLPPEALRTIHFAQLPPAWPPADRPRRTPAPAAPRRSNPYGQPAASASPTFSSTPRRSGPPPLASTGRDVHSGRSSDDEIPPFLALPQAREGPPASPPSWTTRASPRAEDLDGPPRRQGTRAYWAVAAAVIVAMLALAIVLVLLS